jgi:hypothetical protein
MIKIAEIAGLHFNSGSPQFRIKESLSLNAPVYTFYSQSELEYDLSGIPTKRDIPKQVHTFDKVSILKKGDLLFSLISGKATIVSELHEGYLFTQNYVKITPTQEIDARYLAYMLNEDTDIKKQLETGIQGSFTLKFTVKQLSDLKLQTLPKIKTQKIIGELYFKGLKLTALKKRVAEFENILLINKLKEANRHE